MWSAGCWSSPAFPYQELMWLVHCGQGVETKERVTESTVLQFRISQPEEPCQPCRCCFCARARMETGKLVPKTAFRLRLRRACRDLDHVMQTPPSSLDAYIWWRLRAHSGGLGEIASTPESTCDKHTFSECDPQGRADGAKRRLSRGPRGGIVVPRPHSLVEAEEGRHLAPQLQPFGWEVCVCILSLPEPWS